ncbi:Aminotransferase, class IV [Naviculisporaceae sp. PSN 640]
MASPSPAPTTQTDRPKPEASPTFLIHTSLRYDALLLQVHGNPLFSHAGWNYLTPSPLYMLPFHRDRLLRAAIYFNWTPSIDLLTGEQGLTTLTTFITNELKKNPSLGADTPLRLRITLTKSGTLGLQAFPYPPVPLEALFPSSLSLPPPATSHTRYTITLDSVKTPTSEYTHFKTTHRSMYDSARQRAHIDVPSAKKEVLLMNDIDGSVMEGSITTPYFFRNGRWVTPPVNAQYSVKGDSGGNDGTSRRWAIESGLAYEEPVYAASIKNGEECWLSNGASGFFPGKIILS